MDVEPYNSIDISERVDRQDRIGGVGGSSLCFLRDKQSSLGNMKIQMPLRCLAICLGICELPCNRVLLLGEYLRWRLEENRL